MKILGTGLTGLIGSRIVELLNGAYEFEFSDTDITDKEAIGEKINNSNASVVLHLAAKTDVDGCEKDTALGVNGDAWRINVEGTKNVAEACEKSNKKLIYISTDFVFDGEKESEYSEEDKPNPVNWYAKTKYEGEKIVQSSNLNWIIARLAYPYRANFQRKDFVRNLIHFFKNKESLSMVTDHIMTPTFIDDIAFAFDKLLKNDEKGIFHIVGNSFISPYEAAMKIAEVFNFDKVLIETTTRKDFFKYRAPRPFRLAIKNDKIQKLGIKMKTFEEGLRKIKDQIALL
ncbi:MAG: NAD(P)-dependent oxidoreductase [Candidatus Levybacteria bacterium]|nr:NAD(P)-dependent oxidoreductase [Candidatus Levybacteria bacterium]